MKKEIERKGFTIVELLTVMSIIVILLSILLPALAGVRRYAKVVRQKGQFHDIESCLELYSYDYDGYPDSSRYDFEGHEYCGAMKLCEVVMGQDGLGFHPDSRFDDEGQDKNNNDLYYNRDPSELDDVENDPNVQENLRSRRIPCLENQADIASLEVLFQRRLGLDIGGFDPNCVVLCDVFTRSELQNLSGKKLGMPILYYKADPSKLEHSYRDLPDASRNIYSFWDNYELARINVPWGVGEPHPLFELAGGTQGEVFYKVTRDDDVEIMSKPHNPDSYILISAGWDGLYGTRDDVFNFAD